MAQVAPDGFIRYTWHDIRKIAEDDGYVADFCPVCGDLCIAGKGMDAIHQGFAQRNNQVHQEICLELIAQW